MNSRPLFLRWALVNVLAAISLAVLLLLGFADGLSKAPLAATLGIVVVTIVASTYGGYLSWKADDALTWKPAVYGRGRVDNLREVEHNANHLFHTIWLCQILGIIGALMGYRQEASSASGTSDPTQAIHAVFAGLGNGLTATLVGVLCSLLFFVEHRILSHTLERDLRESGE